MKAEREAGGQTLAVHTDEKVDPKKTGFRLTQFMETFSEVISEKPPLLSNRSVRPSFCRFSIKS